MNSEPTPPENKPEENPATTDNTEVQSDVPVPETPAASTPESPGAGQPAPTDPAPSQPEPQDEAATAQPVAGPPEQEAPKAAGEGDASADETEEQETHDEDLQSEIDQFDALIDQHLPGSGEKSPRGEILEVPVVAVREDTVLVDFGGKAEATIPLHEFTSINGTPQVSVGDVIKVVQLGRSGDGGPRLSHREARVRESEGRIREAKESKTPIKGRVTKTVKGGLMVDIGLPAFMPASQVDLFKIPDLGTMVGQEIEAYVIEYDQRRKRAVVSRRRFLFEQLENERQETLSKLAVDQVLSGKVKSALDFGVFLDLGAIDGFIPREEVSYDRGTHPSDIVKVGDVVEARIIKLDKETGKVTLSRKRMQPDPWGQVADKFFPGQKIVGKVVAVQSYGAFVHLEEGVTGMVHASDMSWSTSNKKPSDFVQVGKEVECQVLEVDAKEKRISLGIKQLQHDPWAEADEKYAKGTKLRGKVTTMTNYGVFVRLDEYIEGMVHVSDLTWEKRINHPKEVVKSGEEVDVVVLKVDSKNRRISLGMKQLTQSPFAAFVSNNPVGSVVQGKVTRFAPFGAFVELGPGLEGLIHISQIDDKRVELPEKALSVGEEVTCKVVRVDAKSGKISLSRKDALKQVERDQVRAYIKKGKEAPSGVTFGDLLNQAKTSDDEPKGEDD